MNELAKANQTMSSREIAELTGKRHPDVKRDIRNLNQYYVELGMSRVAHSNYTDQQGKTQIEFLLTKIQTLDLMTGYSIQLRVKVNRRWEELEIEKASGMLTLPSRKEMALMILQAEEELEQANETIARRGSI
jgi:phage regulator Rha-like protein